MSFGEIPTVEYIKSWESAICIALLEDSKLYPAFTNFVTPDLYISFKISSLSSSNFSSL